MQEENEQQWKKSEREHVRHFWKFHDVVVQNNGKEMNKKSELHEQSCFFAN